MPPGSSAEEVGLLVVCTPRPRARGRRPADILWPGFAVADYPCDRGTPGYRRTQFEAQHRQRPLATTDKRFRQIDSSKMMDAESMPLASYSRCRCLHVLHERAKDLLISIPNLLFLSRLKGILRHFPKFFVRDHLFIYLVHRHQVHKETLLAFLYIL